MTSRDLQRFAAARGGAAIASAHALHAVGFTPRRLADLVARGDLRRGVSGYWLPEPPDPAAWRLMGAALDGAFDDDFDDDEED
jgi:hypothetical protein